MSENRYRPGAPRRDPDRSPDYFKDRNPDRSSANRRDDRASDYAFDRYRGPKPTSRSDREPIQDSRRPAPDAYSRSDMQDATSTMDADRAASDLAKRLRLLQEALVDQVKWTNKKDVVLEGYRQRLATYERHGGKDAHEPSVAEAWRKHQDHYKQEEEKIEKELAKVNAIIKDTTDNFACLLVKSLPVGEIKERQLIDAAKLELSKDRRSASEDRISRLEKQLASLSERQNTMAIDMSKMKKENEELRARASPTDDRAQKLEKQMASLQESQKAQEANWDKIMKENEQLRSREALHEAQAADLVALRTQQEQLQLQLSNKAPQDREVEALKQEKEALVSQISAFQTRLADLVERVDSQQAHFNRCLQETTAQFSTSMVPTDPTPLQGLRVVEQQVKALEIQVEKHEDTLQDIDAEEYTRAVTKLIQYPAWLKLEKTIQDQQSDFQRLALETKGLSSNMSNVKLELDETSKRLTAVKGKSESDFMQFSNKIIETCGDLVQNLEEQIKHLQSRVTSLETRSATAARGPSVSSLAGASLAGASSPRPVNAALASGNSPIAEPGEIKSINTAIQGLREDYNRVRNALSVVQNEVRESHSALEMMIIGLDEQFKNISTAEMASIILDNIKRLPTHGISFDVQNLHERLVDLETFRQEQIRRGLEHKDWQQAWVENLQKMTKSKRSLAEDDDGLERPEKRQRMEGVNRMNGTNGVNGVEGSGVRT